jgi:hypothetical protein
MRRKNEERGEKKKKKKCYERKEKPFTRNYC